MIPFEMRLIWYMRTNTAHDETNKNTELKL